MAQTTKNTKAVWSFQSTLTFCDVCIAAIEKDMRPGTHLNAQGWKYVLENFHTLSGLNYDKTKLKNKWDQLKADWKLWKELKGKETGLGWNTALDTVDATPEWWDDKIAVNKDYAKFRKKGIHPDLEMKNNIMFGHTVATGEYCMTPAIQDEVVEDIGLHSPFTDEGNYSSYEVPYSQPSSQPYYEPSSQPVPSRKPKKRKSVAASEIKAGIDEIAQCIKDRNQLDSHVMKPSEYGAEDVMSDIYSISDIDPGSELFYFAISMLKEKENRLIWKSIRRNEEKVGYLKYMLEKSKGK